MMFLILKLMDLVEALLAHFVNVYGSWFAMTSDYQWVGDISSVLTPKGNETVGALSTVIHLGSIFLAQLMNIMVYPFYNTAGGAGWTSHITLGGNAPY